MSDDFGYLNARLRALKGQLLKKGDYEPILAAENLEEVIAFLDHTQYGSEVEQALTLKKGITGVDEGFRRNLEKTFAGLVRMTSNRPRELIHIVMGRWEILNLKTILRGIHINAMPETILANLIPFGRLDDIALGELAKQHDIKAVIDLLNQWRIPYAFTLRKAFPLYREKEDLQTLELALDRAFFNNAVRTLHEDEIDDAIVLDLVRREIDLILISYAMRYVHHGLTEQDPASIFIPKGKSVDLEMFTKLLASRNMEELAKSVPVRHYTECLEAGMFRYLEERRLSPLERAMETCFINWAYHSITRDPLSISVAIAYLWLKINEIINLRIISRGKQTAMPRSEIEKYLVFAI